VEAAPPPPPASRGPQPRRRGPIDRRNKAAIGIRTGSLVGGYRGADAESVYGDLSLGLDARWRLGPLGIDVGLLHADQAWHRGTTRSQTMLSGSAMLFFAPQRRLQPFFDVGLTANAYKLDDDLGVDGKTVWVTRKGVGVGPHLGLGLELALGRSLALSGELRVVHYLNLPRSDWPVGTQLQATLGMLVHF
jgi:hypothetical protein